MEEMYGLYPTTSNYSDKVLMSPENLMVPSDFQSLVSFPTVDHYRWPIFGSDELISVASVTPGFRRSDGVHDDIKARIASHPRYPKLLEAYIDCQKVGAPPEIACLLDEIRRENEVVGHRDSVYTCLGDDPELDEFMDTFCDLLAKYKADLSRPFVEATNFLNKMEMQLGNLCIDEGAVSSEDEFSGGEVEVQEAQSRSGDQELKCRLLRKYAGHISSLKVEFSKKKKKGKLPKEARQKLLDWWNNHYKWPYPTEADKISLAESTGLDQKQINNWFINQRKRHWKPSENMELAALDNISGQFFVDD
ncbi:hypothetical protein NMG60_11030799 [Bertholletia excelsa]